MLVMEAQPEGLGLGGDGPPHEQRPSLMQPLPPPPFTHVLHALDMPEHWLSAQALPPPPLMQEQQSALAPTKAINKMTGVMIVQEKGVEHTHTH